MTSSATLSKFRSAFGRCISCAEKQIGLRIIRNLIALSGRNPAHEAAELARLPLLLAYAQERTERAR